MAFDRVLEFEGCFNFRDVGGYPTVDGRWVRPQYLYRADGPHTLTARDESLLRALGLRTVLDLRTTEEGEERGSYATHVDDVIVYRLPMLDALPGMDDLARWTNPNAMADRYREMLDAAPESVAEALAILSDPSAYPALVHCTAGKDRTGILHRDCARCVRCCRRHDRRRLRAERTGHGAAARIHADEVSGRSRTSRRDRARHVRGAPRHDAAISASLHADYETFDKYAESLDVDSAAGYLRAALLV